MKTRRLWLPAEKRGKGKQKAANQMGRGGDHHSSFTTQKIAKNSLKNSEFGTTRPQPLFGHFHHLPPPESP